MSEAIKGLRIAYLVLLLPAFAEAVDPNIMTLTVQGFPLSAGRAALILCGLAGLLTGGSYFLKSDTFRALFIIFVGTAIGALFSDAIAASLSRTAGFVLLLVGACGVAHLWKHPKFRNVLDAFFIAGWLYWTGYLAIVMVGSGFESYSSMYLAGAGLRNHHIPGAFLSVATVYIAIRFFYDSERLRVPGYAVFVAGLLAILLFESRSNFLFTTMALAAVFFSERRSLIRTLFIVVPMLVVATLLINKTMSSSAALQQRFDVTNVEYQRKATDSRFKFVVIALENIAERPFGTGMLNLRVQYQDKRFLVHNQYITFMIAGGLVALVGILYWMFDLVRTYPRVLSKRLPRRDPFLVAVLLAMVTYCLTLLTIDFSGMLFFVLMSTAIYLSGVVRYRVSARRSARVVRVAVQPVHHTA